MIRLITFCLLICSIFSSCGSSSAPSYGQITDTIYSPRYAQGFEILRTSEGVLLKIFDQQTSSFTLITDKEIESSNLTVIKPNVERVAVMSTSYIAFLDQISEAEKICGVSGTQYVSNPKVLEMIGENRVSDIGLEGAINYEVLAALRPDVLLSYGLNNTGSASKLVELGIKSVPICDYLECSPLGRAEWLVVVAQIMGCREDAIEIFDQIEARYNALKDMAEALDKPTVMFNIPWRDTWYIPSPENYTVQLINDAGGRYICDDKDYSGQWGDGLSRAISGEQGFVWAQKADVWLNTNALKTAKELLKENANFALTTPFNNGRVYNNNLRVTDMGGSDFWESGVVMPDIILADLIAILHPDLMPNHQLYFYRKIE